jgi:redox-sensing transcriptional repressor
MVASGRVSEATVARLPQYLQCAVDAATRGESTISSDALAELAGVNPATLRRDLASLDITGTRGVGYDTTYLVFELGGSLGLNQDWPVVIVGVGNLGRALANYTGLADRGFPVRALLDVDPAVVGTTVSGIEVEHMDDAANVVARERLSGAVLATPPEAAQEAADCLVAAGIRSLLDFTENGVQRSADVEVRRVDLATELQILSFYQQRSDSARNGVGVPIERTEAGT